MQNCYKCKNNAIFKLQHGYICKPHFIEYFEEKVFKTINKFRLISRSDQICIATSGGKDSLTVLYLTKKYLEKHNIPTNNLLALAIDEGIDNYRGHTLDDLRTFCKEHTVPLKIVSFKEECGSTLDAAYKKIKKSTKTKPCTLCGVWRRYLLNKYAKEHGATKVVTGHNLDDEAQVILMNIFKANTKLAARLGPTSGVGDDPSFIQRVKPLYLCSEKEVRLYTFLKGFEVKYTQCPYTQEGYRHQIQEMLNDFEQKYAGTKQGIINSFLALLPALQEQQQKIQEKPQQCKSCGEAANKELCHACIFKELVGGGA